MNISDEAGSPSVTSNAAPLFQAPQFTAPQFQEPAARRVVTDDDAEPTRSEKRPERERPAGRRKRTEAAEAETALDEGTATEETDKPKKSQGRKKTRKKTESEESAPDAATEEPATSEPVEGEGSLKRRRRRTRSASESSANDDSNPSDEVKALKGSTRLEAKRMRRREGRREGRRRQSITEAEFLARRESVDRQMVVRHKDGLDQIAVLEDGLLVEHYVARRTQQSIVGNVYLGRVQNVLPSMEAAFIDIGRGRNAVLYAGEVNWDALGMDGKPRRIEQALSSGDTVLVQVTKDPIGHKGARLTSQVTLAGRYLVLVPGSTMLGISRKLPDTERQRLKKILREAVPDDAGVIVRTAAEGASEEQLRDDVQRLSKQWTDIKRKEQGTKKAPQLLRGEPELVVRVVRDIFNEDFGKLVVQGDETWQTVSEYVEDLSPELSTRLERWTSDEDVFHAKRIDQQLSKGMDRKVWLPSGGTLVIDRTEALTVVDVNTGKFIGSGGTLEETVTRNNLEAAEEIVRQLRLRDIGGIVIIDFVDMVLESNRELVLRRLVECLGRDRTRHQVTEITSLGLVQMTRKRVGEGLVEAFSTTCEACEGRGFIVHDQPVEIQGGQTSGNSGNSGGRKRKGRSEDTSSKKSRVAAPTPEEAVADAPVSHVGEEKVKTALSAIAAATVKPDADEGKEPTGATSANTAPAEAAEEPADSARAEISEELSVEPPAAKTAPSAKAPRRRRVVTAEPTTPTAAATIAASEPPKKARAKTKSAPKKVEIVLPDASQKVSSEPRTKTRRRVVSSESAPATSGTRSREKKKGSEEKTESARQAVIDLLQSDGA